MRFCCDIKPFIGSKCVFSFILTIAVCRSYTMGWWLLINKSIFFIHLMKSYFFQNLINGQMSVHSVFTQPVKFNALNDGYALCGEFCSAHIQFIVSFIQFSSIIISTDNNVLWISQWWTQYWVALDGHIDQYKGFN